MKEKFNRFLLLIFSRCSLCALNTKRRALDQIERQLKNGSANLKTVPGLMNDKIDPYDAPSFNFETKNIDTTDSKDDDYGNEFK